MPAETAVPDDPRPALDQALAPEARAWLDAARERAARDPASLRAAFPAAARRCGRGPLADGWTVDEAARALLLTALPLTGAALAAEIAELYDGGDAAERRAVLRALPLLAAAGPGLADGGLPLVHDAVRSNDTTLIEAALGPYAARRLPQDAYRQAVLKCVFCEIPLDRIAGLAERADDELLRMLADLAAERTAAGRTVPEDVRRLLSPTSTGAV